MIGQFRSTTRPSSSILKAFSDNKRQTASIRKAFDDLPVISERKIPHVLNLFHALIDHMVSRNMIRIKGNVLIEKTLAFMKANIHRPITLDETATAVHKSKSTVSHLFNERMGQSFKQTLIEMKLDTAERLMKSTPGITVSEAAHMVGYDDPFHFSNLYRKHRGFPPSRFWTQEHFRSSREYKSHDEKNSQAH